MANRKTPKKPTPLSNLDGAVSWHRSGAHAIVQVAGPQGLLLAHEEFGRLIAGGSDAWATGGSLNANWRYGEGGSFSHLGKLYREGDRSVAESAAILSSKVDRHIDLGQTMPQPVPTVAGGGLCVPAALGGSPLCFTRQEWRKDASTPLRIALDMSAWSGTSPSALKARGVAFLAVVKAVSSIRPVTVEAFSVYKPTLAKGTEVIVRVPLGAAPLDWAMAATILGSPGALRDTVFRLMIWGGAGCESASDRRESLPISRLYGHEGHATKSHPLLREALGLRDQDLLFDSSFSRSDDLEDNPFAWVQAQIDKYNLKAE